MPEADLLLLRVLDELYLQYPFYGRRRRVDALADRGQPVHRKRVQRWMRILGIEAWYRKPHTSRAHPEHAAYPYRLRGLTINRPNQVGCTEVTYVPRAHGFACLCVARRQAARKQARRQGPYRPPACRRQVTSNATLYYEGPVHSNSACACFKS